MLLSGCVSSFFTPHWENRGNSNQVLEALKGEIVDLKHAHHGVELEVRLLEERVEEQEEVKSFSQTHQVALLQQKIVVLEKRIDRIKAEFAQDHKLLSQYFDEIGQLRSMLSQILKTASNKEISFRLYRVKEGDSIGKISRQFNISPDSLRKENQLFSDKIAIGQELKIPPPLK